MFLLHIKMRSRFVIITLITLFIIGKLEAGNILHDNVPFHQEFSDYLNNVFRDANNSKSELNTRKENYRLPKDIIPTSYEIKIEMKTNFTFTGRILIKVLVKERTDKILLHRGNIILTATTISYSNNKPLTIFDSDYNNVTEILTIQLNEKLERDTEALIAFEFKGSISNNLIGFYKSSYFDENDQIRYLSATQFQAVHARQAFPCFDEPSFKAKFNIRLEIPKGYKCLSNMPVFKEQLSKDKVRVFFNESVPMSTYLVAFVISDLESKNSENLTVWARKALIDQGDYALKIGKESLKHFEETFNQKYQIPKMDMVAVPDFSAGAMENWGLITYREKAMLYHEEESSDLAQQSIATTIVHECTHMWFGNLVTPDWWGVLWLSEGFARYFEYFATLRIEPTWDMDKQFVVAQHQVALSVDGLNSSSPLSRNVASQSEIGKSGDTITYNKGASIIRMMEKSFGSEIFNKALQNFLESRKYDNAVPEHLWAELQKEIDLRDFKLTTGVEKMMNSWTKQPGFPVVTVFIKDGKATLKQSRFLLRDSATSVTNSTWWIPITWTVKSKPNFETTVTHQWVSDNSTIKVEMKEDDWIVFNLQSSGFYRVNYDNESWYKIVDTLNGKKTLSQIHEVNRAAIIDDLMNLARADYLDYNVALDGLKYLTEEINYVPYKAAINALEYLTKRFSGQQEEGLYKNLILTLINKTYRKLGFDDKKNDNRLKILLRMELNDLACRFNHEKCIRKSIEYFENWKSGSLKSIPKNRKFTVYSTAMKNATEKDWDKLWARYVQSDVPTEQIDILKALGCSANSTILEKYLLRAVSSYEENRIRKQDSNMIFNSVAFCSPIGAKFIINFIDKHYKKIIDYNSGNIDSISTILTTVSEYFSTQELIDEFEQLIKSHKAEFKLITASLESTLKLVKYELEWYKNHMKEIVDWVDKFNKKENTSETFDYYLPGDIIPSKYHIHVTPYITENNFTFDGTVEIEAKVEDITDKIVLHAYQIKDKSVQVLVDDVEIKVLNINYTEDLYDSYNFMTISLDQDLLEGTQVTIKINYTGILNDDLRGFYRSSYEDDKGQKNWLASTHLEPTGARRMFPCFDEPAMKANFIISVTRPQLYHAISNMPRVSVINIDENYQKDTFAETPLMSTYLVALVVSQFAYIKDENNFTVWMRPNANSQAQYAKTLITPFLKFYENAFNYQYELPELKLVAIPEFSSGAMENWGLITFKEDRLFYNEETSTLFDKQDVSNVIGHEFTHQWFGNLVTPLWWKYLWLSEGFARYLQSSASDSVENSWKIRDQFVVDHLQTSFDIDGDLGSHAVTHNVFSPSQIRSRFNRISYAKAGSILRMTEKVIGSQLFYKGLQAYLRNGNHKAATPDDLYKAFQDAIDSQNLKLGVKIKTFLDSWTCKPGFPVVNVKVDGENVVFSQERFLKSNNAKYPVNQTWWVPITWTTQSENDFNNTAPKFWFKDDKYETVIKRKNEEWIIFNIQQAGYYRVNYDKNNWLRIITALKSKEFLKIHEINRASLINDLFNFGKTGYVSYDQVLSATQYLKQETNYLPWRAATNGLSELKNIFMIHDIYDLFATHVRTIIEPIFKKLGLTEIKDEDHFDKLLRIVVARWACDFEVPECINHAKQMFANYKNNSSFKISPNLHYTIFCTAIKYGTKDDFDFLKEKYYAATSANEKMRIYSTMSCSQDSEILSSFFNRTVEEFSRKRRQINTKVFSYMYKTSSNGAKVVLNYLQNNFDNIYNYIEDENALKRILKGVSKRISSKHLLSKKFVKLNKKLLLTNLSKSYYSQIIKQNTWYDKYSPKIWEWLETTYPSSNYRLPALVKPTLYDIHLKPYFEDKNFTFLGKVEINLSTAENTSRIILNSKDLEFEEIKVFDKIGNEIEMLSYTINKTTEKLSIYLSSVIKNKSELKINFKYSGYLNEFNTGFYRSSYIDDNKTRWLASTQFQPTSARRAFPCFDEPAFKAEFIIRIERPNDYHTLSNMPLKYSEPIKNVSRTLDVFEKSPLMSTYLVAFVVSEFSSLSNSNISIWSRPNAIKYAQDSLEISIKLLHLMENTFGLNYTLSKMDIVAVPDFSGGAMENWGLPIFRETGILYSENVTSAHYKKYKNTLIAHELVHMWFGNLVTCHWWDYTWLNEGFAQYLENVMINKLMPEWKILDQFTVGSMQFALSEDSYLSSNSLNNNVSSPMEISNGFNNIAYDKAASILRMIHHSFGEKVFTGAIQDYLTKRQLKTATPKQLYESLQIHVNESHLLENMNVELKDIMNSWVNQSGFPVVNVTFLKDKMVLTQNRHLILGSSSVDPIYWIPITYTSKSSPNFENTKPNFWFGNKTMTVSVNKTDEWFILNVQRVGFYRVNYDTDSWRRLINVLKSNNYEEIHEINRAQILGDALNLARVGYVTYNLALNATEYIVNENNYLPWMSLFNEFKYLNNRFEGHEINDLFGEHIRTIIQKVYKKLGFFDIKEETLLDELNRALITKWACKYDYLDCITKSKDVFSEWRLDSSKRISPNVTSTVYCSALKHGTYDDWLFVWDKYLSSNFVSEKQTMLESLGCTKNSTTLDSYLQLAISSKEIRRQNVNLVFYSVYQSGKIGVDVCLEFLMKNYKALYSYFHDWEKVAGLFSNVAQFLSNQEQINKFEKFCQENSKNLSHISTGLRKSLQNAKTNMRWFETYSPEIYEWLRKSYFNTTTTGTTVASTTVASTTVASTTEVSTTETINEITTPKGENTTSCLLVNVNEPKTYSFLNLFMISLIFILAICSFFIYLSKECC